MKRSNGRLALFLAGVFVIKLIVVLQLKDHILLQPATTIDTGAYVGLAAKVIAGDWGLGPGLYYVSPLYIYFLALTYGLTDSLAAVRVLQILLGTASVGLIFLTAREWFNERAAWLAAGVAALTGLVTFYEAVIFQASIDAVLTSTALFLLARAFTRGRPRWYVLAGLAFGVQSLNRPNVLVAAVAIIGLLALMRRWRPSLLLAAGFVAALAPVGLRNFAVSNQFSLVSSHGGLNFLIGNDARATGFFRQVPGITPTIEGQEHDTRRVAEAAIGRSLTDAEVSSYFSDQAWNWIRRHPAAWLGLLAKKLYYVLNAQHIALPLSYPFYAYDENTLLRFLFIGPWLLMPLGLVGLGLSALSAGLKPGGYGSFAPHPALFLVWCSFVPAYAFSVALFFVSERYRLPLFVPLAIGAGVSLDAIARYVAAREVRPLAFAGVSLMALLAIVNWPLHLPDGDGRGEERVHMAENVAHKGDVAEAERWTALALPLYPFASLVHYRVGAQFANVQLWTPAIDHLTKAEQLDPGAAAVQMALGRALAGAGRTKDAIPHLQRAVDGNVEDDSAAYELVVARQQIGDIPGAVNTLQALKPQSQDVEVWLRLGRLAMELKAVDVAQPFFQHAAQMAPQSAAARQQFGLNLLVQRRFDEAVRELGAAATLDPKNADSLANLAYCELQLGRIADARAHVAAALQLEPSHPLALQLQLLLARIKGDQRF